jgi:hypothetical protein
MGQEWKRCRGKSIYIVYDKATFASFIRSGTYQGSCLLGVLS